ncbi:hypothetical protein C8Q75DRAFT_95705 [Abortiporus biennis]|nr:hypothetical protein C8Q75DRAFT_95705 [Abortiporus biennis]
MNSFDSRFFDASCNMDFATIAQCIEGECDMEATIIDAPTKSWPNATSTMEISRSTAFPAELSMDGISPDTVLVSSDAVIFYTHADKLTHVSVNNFNSCLSTDDLMAFTRSPKLIQVSESADLINIILHVIYDWDFAQFSPSLDVVLASVDTLKKYGVSLDQAIAPSKPLFEYILSQAPRRPMDVYVCAASHELYSLAVPVSAYLLSVQLSCITDEQATGMGVIYLKKLLMLQEHRVETLKRLLLAPPTPHIPTLDCAFVEHQQLTRAWALATASLIWERQPDKSLSLIQTTLASLGYQLSCEDCRAILHERIKSILTEWMMTTRNIE